MTDCDTPERVFQHYRAYLAGELSKDFAPDQLDNWIVQLCDTLCKDKSVAYMARFAQLVRKSAHEVGIARSGSVSYTQRTATKGEQMVMQALNFLNLEYLREFRVLNLLEARPNYRYELGWCFKVDSHCRYDFRIISLGKYYGTLIEYDGGHHFTAVKYTETDTDYIRRFETHQNNDRLKRAIAIGLGYKMIRIHYRSPTNNINSMVGAITTALKELETNVSWKCVCVVSESSDGHEYDYLEDPILGMSVCTDDNTEIDLDNLELLDRQKPSLIDKSRPKWLSEIQILRTWIDNQQVRNPINKEYTKHRKGARFNFEEWDHEHKSCIQQISKLLGVDVLTDRSTLISDTVIKEQLSQWIAFAPEIKRLWRLRFMYGMPSSFKAVKDMINTILRVAIGVELHVIRRQYQRNGHREWRYTYKLMTKTVDEST